MKYLTIYLLCSYFVFLISSCALGKARCPSCNIELIPLDGVDFSRSQLVDFCCTIQPECLKSQVEFREVANEAIFHILYEKPEMFINVFDNLSIKKKKIILSMIENPVNDDVDLNKLLENMSKMSSHKNSVNQISSALIKAIGKY